ncbi:restriction endonuclease [Streptomyces hygroscopicus]|uniref:restriction endonuclease n=1 Tax=Streptomyces hygroscopicus TaxID=1912 RepID=UPI001FCA62E6|nr:restriction endonuclease [Streptomyces hygroscopicus]
MYLESSPTADDAVNWRAFEQLVAKHVAALDPKAQVTHDARLKGRLSGIERQIDVLARGSLAGSTITIAFECKCYKRSVGLATIEEFIGKLHDLAVDRGVLCIFGDITEPAFRRLAHTSHPQVDLYVWRKPKLKAWEIDINERGEEVLTPVYYRVTPESFF